MISIKLALRSVFRRPKQNIAVLMGITLGVSLFAGVQIGGDSLSNGFVQFAEHSLGEAYNNHSCNCLFNSSPPS